MWTYDKRLQFPIKIANSNPALAKIVISQYGGPDGELGASLRYLSQRYSMPYAEVKGILTDIGISWEEMLLKYGKSVQAEGGILVTVKSPCVIRQ